MGKAWELGVRTPEDLLKAVNSGKLKYNELSTEGKKMYDASKKHISGYSPSTVQSALKKITPHTSTANYRQLEAKQSDYVSKKAKQYDSENRNFLNPYVPEEALQLSKRGQDVGRFFNTADNPMQEYSPAPLSGIDNSKLWRTLIGNPEEGFGVGDMVNASLMANPAGATAAGAGKVGAKAAEKVSEKIAAPVAKALKSIATKTPVPVKKAAGIGAAATGYETIKGATDKGYAEERQTFPSQFGASLRVGAGDAVNALGSAAEWKGNEELSNKLKATGKKISEGYENEPIPFTWKSVFDPDFYANNLAQSLPTTAMLIPAAFLGWKAGGAAAGKLGTPKMLKTMVSALAGSAASRPLESAIEAGSGYEQAKQIALAENKSMEEAERIATETGNRIFADNLKLVGLDAAQLGLAFAPVPAKAAARLGKAGIAAGKLGFEAGTEALEEGYQQAISQRATGEDTRGILEQITNATPEMQEAMFTGGIIGAGFGGAGVANDLITSIKTRTIESLPDSTMPQVKQRVEEHIQEGMTPKDAIDEVLEEIVEVPEVAEIVKNVTQEEARRIINENATVVYDKNTNEPLQVIDAQNPEFIVVENADGKRLIVPRDDVLTEAPAPSQQAETELSSVVAPEIQESAVQGEIEAPALTPADVLPETVPEQDIVAPVETQQVDLTEGIRSDIGDPAYLNSLEKQYNNMIDAEVANMKSELGGVESIPGRNIRVSANPSWYQEFWQKHLRAPREGEYRDLAIKNLIEGNPETGEPANEEFLSVLSELSRGQKLPEEWHGLQKSIRDTAAMREPELEPLVKEMQAEQTKVEPYGLTRDLSRLDEVENQARTGMADRAGFEQYEGVRFKRDKVQPMQEEVNAFVDEAMADRSQFKTLPLREVSQEEIKIIKELTKTDTSGYFHQLSNNDLWHGLKQHGNAEIEASKGQIPITAEDLKRIPEIIDSYDNITKGSTNKGVKSVIYSKRINGNICYVEVILPRKGVLRSKTMWKEPAAVVHAMPEASPHYTSETDLSANPSTELNISSEGTVGKTMWKEPTRGADAAQNAPVDLNVQNGSSLTASTKLSVTPKETVGNMQENIVKGKGDVKLKRDLNLTPEQQQDLTVLEEIAAQRKLGPFTINKVELAPEAMEKPDFKAAGDIAEKLGLRLVTYKGKGARGAQSGRTLYINEGIKDPVDYVFWHEVGHSMESTHGEHYNQLMSVALEHIGDVKGLEKHYGKFGYTAEDMPHELAADVFAEALSTPGFFGRVAEKAPELLKPLLEAIDSLITRVKSMVSKDDTVMPYLKNLEDLRARVRDEVAMPYFKDTMDEKRFVDTFGKQWQEPAAKAKSKNLLDGVGVPKRQETKFKRDSRPKSKPPGPDTLKHIQSKVEKRVWKDRVRDINGEYIGRLAGKLYGLMLDDLYKLEWFDKAAEKAMGRPLNAAERAHMIARTSRKDAGIAQFILTQGMIDRKFNEMGPSLKKVLSNIPKGYEKEFNDYLVLRNSISWMRQGKHVYSEEYGFKDYVDTIAQLQKKIEQNPPAQNERMDALENAIDEQMQNIMNLIQPRMEWYEKNVDGLKDAADKLVNWLNEFTETWLVKDNGMLKKETWEKFREAHPYYVPFQRVMSGTVGMNRPIGAKRGYANQPYQTKKAVGSQRSIVDPVESIIEQVFRYVSASHRNEVMQAVIHRLLWSPKELEGFASINFDAMKKDFREVLKEDGPEGVIDKLDEALKPLPKFHKSKPNEVTGIWFGQKITLTINDPEFFDALTALTPAGQNMIFDILRACTRVMKTLTTGANIFFSGRNLPRDLPTSFIASKNNNPIVWAIGILDATRRVATNGKKFDEEGYYRLYRSMGGGLFSSSGVTDRNVMREVKQSIMPGYWDSKKNNPISYAFKTVNLVFSGLEQLTSAIETVPRYAEFQRIIEDGEFQDYSKKLEAMTAASEVTVDFSLRGSLGYVLDGFIPYFNAAIRGLDKFGSTLVKNPLATVAKSVLAITVPTITLFLINQDDEDWEKLSRFTKDNYYLIPIGKGEDGRTKFLKMAKPREWGVIYSDIIERGLQFFVQDNPKAFKDFKEAWLTNFLPAHRPIFAPFYDVSANKDFAGRPIIPGHMSYVSPELQYDETNSEFAIGLGKALDMSPKQIDYLIKSYSGFIGQMIVPAFSQGRGQGWAVRSIESAKRSFVGDPLYSNDALNDFYEIKDKLAKARADTIHTGKIAADLNESQRKAFNATATKFSDINKMIREINANPNMSYEQKNKQVERLKSVMIDAAQARVDKYNRITSYK